MKCRVCKSEKLADHNQWWHLRGYFGLTGTFCSDCYDRVSHDSYGQPRRPAEYTWTLLKLAGQK